MTAVTITAATTVRRPENQYSVSCARRLMDDTP